MNLFELFVKIGAKDEASGTISKITSGLGKGLVTAAKIGTAAVGAAATGIAALTKSAVSNYAEYEQLVGGVETLFKENSDTVIKYAKNAYKTAGLSANEYMNTVTSFSASLLQSLGGNTEKAADYADMAIRDMSDNANKMGTSMEMIQNAYQGFAKQNYTMLDNLKLGYGGTKEEMQRLLDKANELNAQQGIITDYQIDSYADIVDAIHVVQTKMGITGTTAKEAGTTIQGAVASMKSAWQNLVTGFANGSADIGSLIDNLVTTIVGDGTESNLGVIGNVLPAIERALGGIQKFIKGAAPKIIEILPGLVEQIVPSLISSAANIVYSVVRILPSLLNTVATSLIENAPVLVTASIALVKYLIKGIQDNYKILVDGAVKIVTQLANGILNMLPEIIKLGLDLIVSLANGIADSLPELIPTIIDVVLQIVDTLTDPETLKNLLNGAMAIITSIANYLVQPDVINMLLDAAIDVVKKLATFLIDNLSPLLNAAIEIIMALVDYILEPDNLTKLVETAIELVVTIAGALVGAAGELVKAAEQLILKIIEKFKETDWKELGRNLVDGFKRGIQNAWSNLKDWFKNLFGDLIGIAKKILGIASPSKVFKKLGFFTADGFGIGFEDEFANVKDDVEDALNFEDASVGINASIRKVGAGSNVGAFGGTSIGNVTINIDGAKYSDENSLAEAIAEALQNMTNRREAVYA